MTHGLDNISAKDWICEKCGKRLPPGIVVISNHWANCEGKEFMAELNTALENKSLTVSKVHQLQEKHLNNKKPSQM